MSQVKKDITAWVAIILTVLSLLGTGVYQAAQVQAQVQNHATRVTALEAKVDDILYNIARICEANGIEDCRSGP